MNVIREKKFKTEFITLVFRDSHLSLKNINNKYSYEKNNLHNNVFVLHL